MKNVVGYPIIKVRKTIDSEGFGASCKSRFVRQIEELKGETMKRFKDKAEQLLDTFVKSTGIGALCFDTHLNLVCCQPSKETADDFICLGMPRITAFLWEKYSEKPTSQKRFYTFFLKANLVSNIVIAGGEDGCIGAFVTQPVLVKKLTKEEEAELTDWLQLGRENEGTLRRVLSRVPTVSYNRIMPLGRMLSSLTQSFLGGEEVRQTLCGGKEQPDGPVSIVPEWDREKEAVKQHSSFSVYLQLKKSIQAGDTESLLRTMGSIDAGSVPMDQLERTDFIRSLKDSVIKACAMSCYMAIDANAPYYKMMDLADETICQMEKLENINDLYELMKNTMLSFTRAVEVTRLTSYSKPVRQVMSYIETHYAEKITLDTLAEHTKLSPTYLSNLIKKETGRILLDNIDRIRIEQSKRLLANANLKNAEVAHRVGFRYPNHFASIFKKFTGSSPTEFRKSMGMAGKDFGDALGGVFSLLTEQLRDMMLQFPGVCDVARIVDPTSHRSWVVRLYGEPELQGTCYDFWNRSESCANCISATAYVQGSAQFKIDRQNEKTYLVISVPRTIGGNIYVVELLKNITNSVGADGVFLPEDGHAGFHSRSYIDAELPIDIRRSRIGGKPLSVIALAVNVAGSGLEPRNDMDAAEDLLAAFAHRISALTRQWKGWMGYYTGDIVLVVLADTELSAARRAAERLKADFEEFLSVSHPNGPSARLVCGVRTLSNDAGDAETLVGAALMALRGSEPRRSLRSNGV